jgi:hypothetical protein
MLEIIQTWGPTILKGLPMPEVKTDAERYINRSL